MRGGVLSAGVGLLGSQMLRGGFVVRMMWRGVFMKSQERTRCRLTGVCSILPSRW